MNTYILTVKTKDDRQAENIRFWLTGIKRIMDGELGVDSIELQHFTDKCPHTEDCSICSVCGGCRYHDPPCTGKPVDVVKYAESLVMRPPAPHPSRVTPTCGPHWVTGLQPEQPEEPQRYKMTYHHCGVGWIMCWSSACNDHCPVCDAEIQPDTIEDLEENDGQPDEQKENEDFAHDGEMDNIEGHEVL